MLKIDNESLAVWCLAPLFSWALFGVLVGIPVHIGLGISLSSVEAFVAIQCGLQIAVCPWLFAARATAGNPRSQTVRRAKVVVVWLTLASAAAIVQVFDVDFADKGKAALALGTPIFVGLIGLLSIHWFQRRLNSNWRT